jgi:hypothetical protein
MNEIYQSLVENEGQAAGDRYLQILNNPAPNRNRKASRTKAQNDADRTARLELAAYEIGDRNPFSFKRLLKMANVSQSFLTANPLVKADLLKIREEAIGQAGKEAISYTAMSAVEQSGSSLGS